MSRLLNPFIPDKPVDPKRFIGRKLEISELESALAHAQEGLSRHFLVTGDRGIGKTSLLDYIRKTATGYDNEYNDGYNFIVIDIVIDHMMTRFDLIKKSKYL